AAEKAADELRSDLASAKEQIELLKSSLADARSAAPVAPPSAGEVAGGVADTGGEPAEDKPVSINELLTDAKPLLKKLTPIFAKARQNFGKRMIDDFVADAATKYGLSEAQQKELGDKLFAMSEEEAGRMEALLDKDQLNIADFAQQGRRGGEAWRDRAGEVAKEVFTEDQYAAYEADQLRDRAAQLEERANNRVDSLSESLSLSEEQKDQVFGILVRSSPDFDPALAVEGAAGAANEGVAAEPPADQDEAILAVLDANQQETYRQQIADREARRQQQVEQRNEFLKAIGVNPAGLPQMEAE
ncbi:MAG: hypothetical protein R3F11_28560, partial [Verrucomicrobiales bacterium]